MEQLVDPFFLRQLRDGKCVLFAGAGLSAAAGFPTWENLLGEISSELSVRQSLHEEGVIWLNIFRLLNGDMTWLDLSGNSGYPARVRTGGVLAQYLRVLVTQLAASCELLLFPYDWRQDYWRLADELRDFLRREVEEGASCDIVAFSEGGLVARAFIAENREAWDSLHGARGGRLVMLGTPNHGSFAALMMLLGESKILKTLGALDVRHTSEEIRQIFASFPSFYQTLPSPLVNAAWAGLYQRESYGDLDVSQELLQAGMQFHKEIAAIVEPERMVCVLGDGRSTVVSVEDPSRLNQAQAWAVTSDGDGIVAHSYDCLAKDGGEVPTYYANVEHGLLANDEQVARAVLEILEQGETGILPRKTGRADRH